MHALFLADAPQTRPHHAVPGKGTTPLQAATPAASPFDAYQLRTSPGTSHLSFLSPLSRITPAPRGRNQPFSSQRLSQHLASLHRPHLCLFCQFFLITYPSFLFHLFSRHLFATRRVFALVVLRSARVANHTPKESGTQRSSHRIYRSWCTTTSWLRQATMLLSWTRSPTNRFSGTTGQLQTRIARWTSMGKRAFSVPLVL